MPAGGRGDVRVVVDQPAGGGSESARVVGGGERAGIFAQQVVQQVAAGRRLGDQMMVVELIELAAGGLQAGVVEGRRGVGVDVRPGDQAEPAEQPLLGRGEVAVGQVERGRDRQVLGAHDGQPVASRRQVGGEFRTGPGRVMPQLRASIPIASGRYPHSRAISPAGPAPEPRSARPASRASSATASAGDRVSEAEHRGVL